MSVMRRGFRHATLVILLSAVYFCSAVPAASQGKDDSTAGVAAANPRISKDQAVENALKVLPGKVTDVTMERKRGKMVWVIEIVADKDGAENDVLVDMNSGVILGVER